MHRPRFGSTSTIREGGEPSGDRPASERRHKEEKERRHCHAGRVQMDRQFSLLLIVCTVAGLAGHACNLYSVSAADWLIVRYRAEGNKTGFARKIDGFSGGFSAVFPEGSQMLDMFYLPSRIGVWKSCLLADLADDRPPTRHQLKILANVTSGLITTSCQEYPIWDSLYPSATLEDRVERYRREVAATLIVCGLVTIATIIVGTVSIIMGQVLAAMVTGIMCLVIDFTVVTAISMFVMLSSIYEISCLPIHMRTSSLPCGVAGLKTEVKYGSSMSVGWAAVALHAVGAVAWLYLYRVFYIRKLKASYVR